MIYDQRQAAALRSCQRAFEVQPEPDEWPECPHCGEEMEVLDYRAEKGYYLLRAKCKCGRELNEEHTDDE